MPKAVPIARDGGADRAEADDPERRAGEVPTGERVAVAPALLLDAARSSPSRFAAAAISAQTPSATGCAPATGALTTGIPRAVAAATVDVVDARSGAGDPRGGCSRGARSAPRRRARRARPAASAPATSRRQVAVGDGDRTQLAEQPLAPPAGSAPSRGGASQPCHRWPLRPASLAATAARSLGEAGDGRDADVPPAVGGERRAAAGRRARRPPSAAARPRAASSARSSSAAVRVVGLAAVGARWRRGRPAT